MGTEYTYHDPRLDSRDLLERLDDLAAREDDEADPLDDDERDELDMLRKLQDETEGYSGDSWRDGVFFIAADDFEDYARELAEDIGAIDRNADWPLSYIDWEAAADALTQDYTSCEIAGRDYWYR